jgi:hypothetical protein
MATYKGIQGYRVESLASDPPAAIGQGQLWYNSASNVWKVGTVGAGAWAAGGSLNVGRPQSSGMGFGIQTAAICAGGNTPPITLKTEQYNGTAWTELASPSDLTYTAYTRNSAAAGTTTAGLMFGGNPGVSPPWTTNDTEIWNGSTWAETGDMNSSHRLAAGLGTSTAAVCAGGYQNNGTTFQATEEFNGASWATIPGGDMNTDSYAYGSTGIQTAGMVAGGTPALTQTETYDGSTWTALGNILNHGRNDLQGFGSITAAIFMGGDPSPGNLKTESFNGTSWTEVADSTLTKYNSSGAGTQSLGLGFGGPAGSGKATEEWHGAPEAIQTVTTS